MGEIADWMLGRFLGRDDYSRKRQPYVTCTRCGEERLRWKETPNGWRLAKDGELHVCASPDVTNLFDVIEEEK